MTQTLTDSLAVDRTLGRWSDDPIEGVSTEEPVRRRRRRFPLLRGRGLVGLLLVLLVFAAGLCAPWLTSYGPNEQIENANLLPSSWSHWLGTDAVNRDVLTRVLYGIRVDVLVAFIAVPLGAVIGALIGIASTLNSAADVVVQRVFDVLFAFPAIIFAIGLTAITGPGLRTVIIVVAAVEVPLFGRLLRTSILRVREQLYVQAAEVIGARRWWVLRRHVLPNAAEPIFVQLALSMSVAVFLESAMSFMGIGVRPPDPSLGSVISDSLDNLDINAMFAVGPLLAVGVLVLGFQLIAQAIGAHRRR